MPTRMLRRNATILGAAYADRAPIYVDADDNKVKAIVAGTGTTEVELVDTSAAFTLTGVITSAQANVHTGAETHSGVETHSGAETHTGLETGFRSDVNVLASGDLTLTAAMSDLVVVATAATGTQTLTLPSAATEGLVYTAVCGNAGGEILITPAASQTISCMASVGGANVTTAGGTGIKNTAATNIKNDLITLISDGTTSWYTIAQSGIWASQ